MMLFKIHGLAAVVFSISFFTNNLNAQQIPVTNQSLNKKEISIISISSLAAQGDLAKLKAELTKGLEAELTVNEIKELLVQLYAYCGFPRSLNAINVFKTVLEERKAKGINDREGKEIVIENAAADKYEQGRKTLETLTKMPQPKPAVGFGEFAPVLMFF